MVRNSDFLSGLLFIALGLAFGIGGTAYRFGTASNMGAGFLPVVLAVALGLLGVAILIKAWARGTVVVNFGAIRPFAIIIGTIVLFALLLRPLGFAATAFITVFAATFAGDHVPLLQRVLPAAILTVLATVTFVNLLGLPIPVWPGFLG